MKRKFVAAIAALSLTAIVHGEITPMKMAIDHRVRTVAFTNNQVYKISGVPYTATIIKFGKDETIKPITGGDSSMWQILPLQHNILSLKPLGDARTTSNLTVITQLADGEEHIYQFELNSYPQSNKSVIPLYKLSFSYPLQEQRASMDKINFKQNQRKAILSAVSNPSAFNWDYSYFGNRNILPYHVFDNGKETYFQIQGDAPLPAFFTVNKKGELSVVDFRRVDSYIIINKTAPQFVLKYGHEVVNIFNNPSVKRALENEA